MKTYKLNPMPGDYTALGFIHNFWALRPGDMVINQSEAVVCFIYFGFIDHHHRFLTSQNKIVSLPTQELTLCNN